MNAALFALTALVPTMVGPPVCVEHDTMLTVQLCSGGSIALSVPGKKRESAPTEGPKGCHAGCSRRRF